MYNLFKLLLKISLHYEQSQVNIFIISKFSFVVAVLKRDML